MNSAADWLNGSLKSIDHELFNDVIKISGKVGHMNDGTLVVGSDINRVTLTLETSSGEKRTLNAVAKFEPPPGPGRVISDESGGIDNETMMYSEILKQMEKLMTDVGDSEYMWPECYHCGDNKFLLQDLCEAGYRIVPTYKFLDVDHSLLVMKSLGKFHGLSMVMDSKGILDKTKLKPYHLTQGTQFIVNSFKMCMEALSEDIEKSWGQEWSSVPDKMRKFIEGTKEKLLALAEASPRKYQVLNHGDFSMRNMLFHYKPNSDIPDFVKIIDFQTVHWNNPGFDVSYLLYSSMLPQVRDGNMDLLLNTYIESLTFTCKQYNYQGDIPDIAFVTSSMKSLNFLNTCISFTTIPLHIISGTEDMQKMNIFSNEETPNDDGMTPVFSFYRGERVAQIMKYEVERCIKDNIF